MNDDFLYRLRVDPSPEFAARLKTRLDAQSRVAARAARWGIPLLLFGAAFALALPQVRDAFVRIMSHQPSAAAQADSSPARAVEPAAVQPLLIDVVVTVPRLDSAEVRMAVRELLQRPPLEAPVPTAPLPRDDVLARRIARLDDLVENASPLPVRDSYQAVPHSSTMQDEAWAALELRRSLFRVMGRAVEPLIRTVRDGQAFDADSVGTSASRLQQLAPLIQETFARDTRGFDLPTRALDLIWRDKALFNARADDLSEAANALAAASRANDLGAAARAMRRIFEACEDCHESYRRPDRKGP